MKDCMNYHYYAIICILSCSLNATENIESSSQRPSVITVTTLLYHQTESQPSSTQTYTCKAQDNDTNTYDIYPDYEMITIEHNGTPFPRLALNQLNFHNSDSGDYAAIRYQIVTPEEETSLFAPHISLETIYTHTIKSSNTLAIIITKNNHHFHN